MGRPSKPIDMRSSTDRHKDRYNKRKTAEEALKGNEITIPKDITNNQKNICKHIIGELEKSGILCSLDEYVLEQCAVAVDCLHKINQLINSEDESLMFSKDVLTAKEKYDVDFSSNNTAVSAKNKLTTQVMLVARPSIPSVRFTALTVPITTNRVKII